MPVALRVHGYTTRSFPVVKDASKYLTVTYYDNYDFTNSDNQYSFVTGDVSSVTVNGTTYSQESAANTALTGKVTGTKVKVLDTDIYWIQTVSYYDSRYRVIQAISDHQRTGIQRVTNILDFAGKILKSKTTYIDKRIGWTGLVKLHRHNYWNLHLIRDFSYLRLWRLLSDNCKFKNNNTGRAWFLLGLFGIENPDSGFDDQNKRMKATTLLRKVPGSVG